MNKLTILIPVREDPKIIREFIEANIELLKKYKVVVVDRSGGQDLKPFASTYIISDVEFWVARKLGMGHITSEFTLNLDSDQVIPEGYVDQALRVLENNWGVGVVALDHEELMGHLGFGTSIWPTQLLKHLYDWRLKGEQPAQCECIYMWDKVVKAGFKVETLNMRSRHLKKVK